jgi:predicted transcriptional regulator
MSAYTNPTIIQDLYGAKAWADASSQVSAALVSGFNQVVEARNKQADIVQKKKEIYQKSYISAEQKALEASEANFIKLEDEGADKGFIEQAREQVEFEMYGGVYEYKGFKKDYGIGTIKMAAEVNSNLDLDSETRKKYQKAIASQQRTFSNFSKEAAIPLADKEDFEKVISGAKGYYLSGTGAGQYTNYLVGSSIYNKPLPSNVEVTNRAFERVQNSKGDLESIMKLSFKIKAGTPEAASYSDESKYPVVDGYINVDWSRNLSDGSWDGNIARQNIIPEIDYNSQAKEFNVVKNGQLNKQYKHKLAGTKTKGDTLDQVKSMEFVNIEGALSSMKNLFNAKAGTITRMLQGNPTDQQDAYNYLESLGRAGIDYADQIKSGKFSEEDVQQEILGYINDDFLTHFNLGQERDAATGKFVNQKVNGLELQKRMITQEQIDELKEAGVDVSNVKPGTEQYFYIEESDVSKPSKNNSNNSKEFTGDANERRLKLYKDVFAEGEDAAKEFFEVARTLGDGTGGRKLIYKPSTDLFMIENKDGDPTGEGKTFEQAKKLYR